MESGWSRKGEMIQLEKVQSLPETTPQKAFQQQRKLITSLGVTTTSLQSCHLEPQGSLGLSHSTQPPHTTQDLGSPGDSTLNMGVSSHSSQPQGQQPLVIFPSHKIEFPTERNLTAPVFSERRKVWGTIYKIFFPISPNFFQSLKKGRKERRRRDREDLHIFCRQLHLLVILPSSDPGRATSGVPGPSGRLWG